MTDDKINAVLELYAGRLRHRNYQSARMTDHAGPIEQAPMMGDHLLWMCGQAKEFVAAGRREKVMRWLGFLQGALWVMGEFDIEELKRHNMPDGADFSQGV